MLASRAKGIDAGIIRSAWADKDRTLLIHQSSFRRAGFFQLENRNGWTPRDFLLLLLLNVF
ncbi:MAG TPA: hypothetical protein DCL66_13820 [Gammaproteobacteria bacterium]|nr:hypothetical protein [Gammaproteobacteria bacterium]